MKNIVILILISIVSFILIIPCFINPIFVIFYYVALNFMILALYKMCQTKLSPLSISLSAIILPQLAFIFFMLSEKMSFADLESGLMIFQIILLVQFVLSYHLIKNEIRDIA